MIDMEVKEKGFAQVNGAEIYYEVKGTGQPLLLLHGMPLDSRMWDEQTEGLSRDFKVIRFDFSGCGKSGVHDEDYSFTDDIKTLLEFLEIEQTTILGFSVGGQIAIDFTLEHPEKVRSLILASSGLPGWNKMDSYREAFNENLRSQYEKGDLQEITDAMAGGWVTGPTRTKSSTEVQEKFKAMAVHNLSRKKGKGNLRLPDYKAIDKVEQIEIPVLLITSEHDFPMFSEIAGFLNKSISGSSKVSIPNTAHMLNMEEPAVFNNHVRTFLKEQNK
jgi:3-oxoadipate enol-lactonase